MRFRIVMLLIALGMALQAGLNGQPVALAEECAQPGCWHDILADDQFSITLMSNPSTGYRWVLLLDGDNNIELLSDEFQPGAAMLGAPGKQVFTFRVLGEGYAVINMTYTPPRPVWSPRRGEKVPAAGRNQ
jgi:predicted secreted protein